MEHPTSPLIDALTSPTHWFMALITALLVGICVLIHYQCLQVGWRLLVGQGLARHGHRRMVAIILGLLGAHVIEIWIFGTGYSLLLQLEGTGSLVGLPLHGLLDHVYFSAVTYTTLGFGDITPQGPIRLLVGTEAITGLALVTWSASLTFLAMQRNW